MSYVEKNLIAGEKLVYRTGVHWSVLFWPFVFTVLVEAAALATFYFRRDLVIVAAALIVAAAIPLIYAVLKRNATEIAVTNRRVMIKTGMFSLAIARDHASEGREHWDR